MIRIAALFVHVFISPATAGAQPLSYVFQHVTTEQGLSTGGVTSICQDRYGYLWMGANSGLNRYDGYAVRVYEHVYGDSNSVLPSQVRFLHSDSEGRLWISFMHGLMEYDFARNRFRQYAKNRISFLGEIIETAPHRLHIATGEGLAKLNTSDGQLTLYRNRDSLLQYRVRKMARYRDELYLLCGPNLLAFDLHTEKSRQIPLPPGFSAGQFNQMAIDGNGVVWLASGNAPDHIYRTDILFKHFRTYNDLAFSPYGLPNAVANLYTDRQQRLWAATGLCGLALFDKTRDKFQLATHNPLLPNSILSNHTTCMFQDRQGFLWVGSSGSGASYCHPDYNLFRTILPTTEQSWGGDELWARAAVETPDGQLWLATGIGLVRFDLASGQYRVFQNLQGQAPALYSNSVRSLCVDRKGNLWVGTADGVNRLRPGAHTFDFLTEKEGFIRGFTLGITEDRRGTIWVATQGDGIYYLLPGEKRARGIREHPVLQLYAGRFGHTIFEDSRGLLWMGLNGRGLICFDPEKQTARFWERSPENDSTLIGNYIYSFTEDKKGIVWVCTSNGISAIDPARQFQFSNFDRARGLPTNRTLAIMADRRDRLWVGTSRGLLLLDSTRQLQRLFDSNDGLPVNEFSDMPAYQMRDGRFLFPSRRGFVLFDPEDYQVEKTALPLYLSQVNVFNRPFAPNANLETLRELDLPPGQNFFTLEMTALNYRNPQHTRYAYKLEPFDREWTYTHDRAANYTDVPAGRYTFRYKATTDPNNWDVPEQTLRIHIAGHWYKSGWFWGALTLCTVALGGLQYRRRRRYRQALLALENKAQALSKEKALVQYENLTQQLNPHFLFNSLASLGSLIRFDARAAGEFLDSLSKMYRYILHSGEQETVALPTELAFAAHFIKLQKTRFGEALQVLIDLDEDQFRDAKIVPVTLQNLLENAIKHNTLDQDEPLRVDIFAEGDYLVVRNNLQLRPIVETSNKLGLKKLSQLYSYLTDRPFLVEKTDTHFVVKIPFL